LQDWENLSAFYVRHCMFNPNQSSNLIYFMEI
jgi:hypothetical protein